MHQNAFVAANPHRTASSATTGRGVLKIDK